MTSATAFAPGTVVLVGGGPGDPGLITVAGLAALRQAEVILYDQLAPQECLAEAAPGAELIDVGKLPRSAHTPQAEINALLIRHAQAGKRVVRFKGGDAFVFGRGGEEWQACAQAGVTVSVIPGVTSAIAAAELAHIPVTHRGLTQGVTIVSGHVPPDSPHCTVDWAAVAKTNTTIVILMGVAHLGAIVATLLGAGLNPNTPAAVIQRAGAPSMQVWRGTVDELPQAVPQLAPPAVTVIGQVVGLDLNAAS